MTYAYSPIFVTPERLTICLAKELMGIAVNFDGVPFITVLESFSQYVARLRTAAPAQLCLLCPKELRELQDVGCAILVLDPVAKGAQTAMWSALCAACHGAEPETAERRMMRKIADVFHGTLVDIDPAARVQ
jgi:hypothetical protein